MSTRGVVREKVALADPSEPNNVVKPNSDGSINVAYGGTAPSTLEVGTAGTSASDVISVQGITSGVVIHTSPISGQVAVAAGAGAVGATVQRMTLASDDPAVTQLAAIAALLAPAGALVVDADGRSVSAGESGTIFSNEGASARDDFSLPTAVAGLRYTFIVQDSDGVRVIANTGDTIRIATDVSASAGRIDSTTIGSSVSLLAINATEWVAYAMLGTWTVT